MNYSIKDTTLTALGDAVRSKVIGTSELPTAYVEKEFVRSRKVYSYNLMPDYVKKVKIIGVIDYSKIWGNRETFPSGSGGTQGLGVVPGVFTSTDYNKIISDENYKVVWDGYPSNIDDCPIRVEFETFIEGNTWTFVATKQASNSTEFEITYTAYGLDENGNEFKYTPLEMANIINGLEIPNIEPIVLTGSQNYGCAGALASQFIKNFGDKVSTKDITNANYMFNNYTLATIPFDINCKSGATTIASYVFSGAINLTTIPNINNCRPSETSYIFTNCYSLRELPDNYGEDWDWSHINTLASQYSGNRNSQFNNCYSLRKIPMTFLQNGNPVVYYSYSIYSGLASYCYCLDEIVDLPNPHINASWTSNAFNNTVNCCNRLKEFTFAPMEKAPQWKNQTIDLSSLVGYGTTDMYIYNYNSGITADKRVINDATYQALKNDPDWWSVDINYSRYNHDSAVNTINSLPDTSAYGTNTIKFKGAAGAKTDGGAINTLTDAEIAVATAKGWTVSLV